MPKVVIEFNLPEERVELSLAQNGSKYHCVISDLLNQIKRSVYYDAEFNGKPENKVVLEDVRVVLWGLLKDYEVEGDF